MATLNRATIRHVSVMLSRGMSGDAIVADLIYHAESGAPLPDYKDESCPNCDDSHSALLWCDGCEVILCLFCWQEHNKDAPDHTVTKEVIGGST